LPTVMPISDNARHVPWFPESLWSDKNVDATRRVGPALASMLVGLI
jgi:hypothetical protein